MINRLENRVAKLEQVKSAGKDGVIIFFKNVEHEMIIKEDRKVKVMKNGDFYTDGSGNGNSMNLEQMREYLGKGKYQAITFLPLRDMEK